MQHGSTFRRVQGLALAALLLTTTASPLLAKPETLNRDEIPTRYTWNLSDIYPGWDAWDADYAEVEKGIDKLPGYQGRLKEGPNVLLEAFNLQNDLTKREIKLYGYASLLRDQDLRSNDADARYQRVMVLFAKESAATSWLTPELLTIAPDTMWAWMDREPDLQTYRFDMEDLYRSQEHVLDEKGEQLLAFQSRFNGTPWDIYQKVATADIEFPTFTLSDGEEVTLTEGRYFNLLHTCRNRDDRAKASKVFAQTYIKNLNTYAAIYNATCQRDLARAKSRNFDNTLEGALFGKDIPVDVVENLIQTARDGVGPMQRYYRLRQKTMGLEDFHGYDRFLPLVDVDKEYPFDEAADYVYNAVKPLGKEYQSHVREAIDGRWIDVYENEGKTSGFYSRGVYGVHPYMLFNYTDNIGDVFTFAHEMGHSMHSVLSNENQPFNTAFYTIFVAEVASTMNEQLMHDYLMERTDDPKERIVLLQRAINDLIGTFYTQVFFADFELQAHRMVENGQPITAESLNKLYMDLLETYNGDAVVREDYAGFSWSRISHFYRSPYYVYQYATSYAASAKLHEDLTTGSKKERNAAMDRYMTLLKSGGNDYPINQLKKAGVDMTQPEVVQAVVDRLDQLVTQLETELNRI